MTRSASGTGTGPGSGSRRGLDPVALLHDAVAIASPSGDEAEVARYLVERMATVCDEAFVDAAGNAVGVWGGGPLAVTVLGHIDTVPGTVPVRLDGGRLWGRGSVDAKGPFCAAVAAASRLPDALRARLTVRLIGAVGEEAPHSAGARHALEAYPVPDLLIVGEPSGWDAVTLGYKGRLVAEVEAVVPNFHSAGEGETAAEVLVAAWDRARRWADAASAGVAGVFDAVQVRLQHLASDGDGLEQRGRAVVGIRLPPGLAPATAEGQLREAWHDLAAGGSVALRFTGHEAAHRAERDTTISRALRIAIRRHGGRPRFVVKTGTSDMNVVAPVWQVPMLAYGPGDAALDHRPDEHIDLAELEKAVAVLATAFEILAA